MTLKKIQMTSILVLSMIFAGFFIASPRVSAATSSYLYSCPAGTTQFIVMEPESPFVTCWTDSNGNGAIEQSDEFRGPTRHISGEAESGYSVAEVTCANSEPKESARRFSCLDGSGPSVIIRDAQAGETPTGDLQAVGPGTLNYGGPYICGDPDSQEAVTVSFNIGCKGRGNPIIDLLFAIIRFLTNGIGIVLVGALIVTGIQHTLARDKPDATANLVKRLLTLASAIVMYLLTYALLNYLIPGQLLK